MDMSSRGRDEEDLASCSAKDRESKKCHAPTSPLPTEFGTAIPQEHFDQGLEYAIPLEGPDSQEERGRRRPRHTHKSDTNSHSSEEEGRCSRKKGRG